MYENVKIVYKGSKPYGIRDRNGYLLFFAVIEVYPDQLDRYKAEVKKQRALAESIINAINGDYL